MINKALRKLVEFPKFVIFFLLLVFGLFLNWVDDFQLDASSDTLLLEGDKDLRYYKDIKARYGDDEFLVVTYQPHADLFDPITINSLSSLRNELEELNSVDSVVSILDVPLLKSPPKNLSELAENAPNYLSPETNKILAKDELLNSTLYKNLIISNDGRTTALLLNLVINESLNALIDQRDELRAKRLSQALNSNEKLTLEELSTDIKNLRTSYRAENALMIKNIRAVLSKYQDDGKIFLGGVPMITVDMIDFIQNDIEVFGISLLLFLIISLLLIFKNPRWMFISMACCLLGLVVMTGFLGIVGWPVTVVSANFVALLLIFSLSVSVHLTVRYLELNQLHPKATQIWLVQQTLVDKWEPCLYTTITTMVGFASLLVAGLKPVIDFGWMMLISMGAIFIMVFLLFPSILVQLKKLPSKKEKDLTLGITNSLSDLVLNKPKSTFSAFFIMAIISTIGIFSLTAENQFIKAFKENTEIYQGLSVIDRELGGTTPLDIIIDADPSYFEDKTDLIDEDEFFEDGFFEDGFFEEDKTEYDIGADSYWYNSFRLKTIDSVHDYLESLDEAGKVVSISTTMDVLKTLNDGEEIDTFFLSLLYKKVPKDVKEALFDPYLSEDGNQLRISFRVFESYPDLQRNELIKKIKKDLVEEIGLKESQVKLTGMLVLYNNVLESLIRSQILTIGVVFIAILIMFLFLFRSLKYAFVAIIPSILASASVLGLMGWLAIPLDIMTITIAAICIGIGVDHSIHYIHRFREEIKSGCSSKIAVKNSHASIGKAIYYTSIIIIIGFSILSLSNFVPTIYFGTFTAFAMLIALIANLTLLPLLLININSDNIKE